MIQAGVVGYGLAGRYFHAYLLGLADGINLSAVVSRSVEKRQTAEADYGIATYESLDQMLEDDKIQLVVIATPHDTHAPMAIQAMDAGKHVVVDKVMCLTAAEADQMIAASERNGVMLSVFHNRRWDWDFLTVQKAIADGLLGEPFLFETAVFRYRGLRSWRSSKAQSGGLLFDWGAHLIDQALQLVPSPPVSVYCDGQKHMWQGDSEDHINCMIKFENGTLYSAHISNLARISKPRWYVLGTTGSLIKEGLDPQEPFMKAGNIDGTEEDPENRARIVTELNGLPADIVLDSIHGNWRTYYQNISDVLNNGAELAITAQSVRGVMAVLDAAETSMRTGGAEKVNAR